LPFILAFGLQPVYLEGECGPIVNHKGKAMPAAQMMGWNVASKRWFKKHGGKVKAVGCPTLSKMYPTLYVGPTKEGSRSAANQWWRDQLVKYALDASTDRRPHAGYWQAELAQHKARRQWYASQGDQTGQDDEQRQVECIESALAQAALPDPLEAYDTTATLTLPSYKSTDIDAALWADQLARSVKPSQKYSIAGLVGVFLKTRERCVSTSLRQFRAKRLTNSPWVG